MTAVRVLVLLAATALAGCTTLERSYEGYPADQVWTAMKSVANEPRYPDWHVRSNNVWVDEDTHRIEVEREVHRQLYDSAARNHYEDKSWQFQIRLEPLASPTIVFVSRGMAIPSHAQFEAQRYFDDVADVLAGDK